MHLHHILFVCRGFFFLSLCILKIENKAFQCHLVGGGACLFFFFFSLSLEFCGGIYFMQRQSLGGPLGLKVAGMCSSAQPPQSSPGSPGRTWPQRLPTFSSHQFSYLCPCKEKSTWRTGGRTPYISKAMSSLRQSGSAFPRLGFLRRTNRKEAEPINKVSGEPEQNEFYSPGLSAPSPVFSTGSGSLAAGMHKNTHVPLFQTPPTHPQPLLAPLFNLFPGFRPAFKNEL